MSAASRAVIAVAAAVSVGAVFAPVASAEDSVVHTLGSPAQLVNGDVVQAWTVKDLRRSSDAIPYPVAGTLWEATATDAAVQGTVQPVVSNLNARARSGQTYRVLFGVATPQGVNPAALSQGQQTTGKVYFDVTGDAPDSVVYSAGGPDLAVWVQPPPAPPRAAGSSGSGSSSSSSVAGGATPAAPADASTPPATPGVVPTAVPGSAGTPVAPGSQGTPLAPGSTGTPVVPGSQGTPAPGSSGTPVPPAAASVPPGAEVTPSPAAVVPATPAPAVSSGTPAAGGAAPVGQAPLVAPATTVAPPA